MKTRYGWVEIDGIRYDHDVIVHTDRQVTKRSKKRSKKFKKRYRHTPLAVDELNFLKTEKPQVVYIGTGQFGDLPLPLDTLCMLREYEPVIRPTPEALEYLENETRVAVAILHVCC